MRVIQNKWIPFKGYKYINLFGLIFTRDASKINAKEYNHEKIHLKQMQEMLWLPFYLWYGQSTVLLDYLDSLTSKMQYITMLALKKEIIDAPRESFNNIKAIFNLYRSPKLFNKDFQMIPIVNNNDNNTIA